MHGQPILVIVTIVATLIAIHHQSLNGIATRGKVADGSILHIEGGHLNIHLCRLAVKISAHVIGHTLHRIVLINKYMQSVSPRLDIETINFVNDVVWHLTVLELDFQFYVINTIVMCKRTWQNFASDRLFIGCCGGKFLLIPCHAGIATFVCCLLNGERRYDSLVATHIVRHRRDDKVTTGIDNGVALNIDSSCHYSKRCLTGKLHSAMLGHWVGNECHKGK